MKRIVCTIAYHWDEHETSVNVEQCEHGSDVEEDGAWGEAEELGLSHVGRVPTEHRWVHSYTLLVLEAMWVELTAKILFFQNLFHTISEKS